MELYLKIKDEWESSDDSFFTFAFWREAPERILFHSQITKVPDLSQNTEVSTEATGNNAKHAAAEEELELIKNGPSHAKVIMDIDEGNCKMETTEKTIEKTIEKKIEKMIEKTIERTIEKMIEKTIERTIEKTIEKKIQKTIETGTDKSTEKRLKKRLKKRQKLQKGKIIN